MKSALGTQLRQLRLNSGLSFRALEMRTKISVQHLRNLEKERFDNLPAPVFVCGFLQKWAQATNGNAEELQRIYNEHVCSFSSKNPLYSTPLKVFHLPSLRFVFMSACIVGVIGLFSYISYQQFIVVREPLVQVTNPTDGDSVSLTKRIHLEGTTQSVEHLVINGNTVVLQSDGTFFHQYDLKKGFNEILFVATNEQGRSVKIIRNILYGG